MAYKKQYTLHDFKEDARTRYPVQFTLIANIAAYRFERISYVASNQEGRQADMFSVGHYYNKHSGSNVWAHADGHHVRYYFGKPTEVCTLVPDVHATWVYYHEPFKLMGMKQGCPDTSRNMSAARRYEKAVFQMVVHFIFLLGGRLVYVSNSTNTDMLSHIKFAWTALEHSIKNESNASRAVLEQTRNSEDRDTMFKDQTELNRAVLDADGPISQDDRRIMTSSPSRSHLDAHNALPGQGSHHRVTRTSLLEHVINYESQIDAEITQAKEDILFLQAKVAVEGQSRRNAKDSSKEWRPKYEEEARESAEWKRK